MAVSVGYSFELSVGWSLCLAYQLGRSRGQLEQRLLVLCIRRGRGDSHFSFKKCKEPQRVQGGGILMQ